ncbi:extracellular solute-binding protein [Paenibacillus andongensis]|uniref:extracellular solute-binding protein n=1 Tax=Paenibacillus andongensis TaxID=2975482 RepID=UPI0021BADC98|nr:extracellular solute-binding protein [Paenibacillus andongensis]
MFKQRVLVSSALLLLAGMVLSACGNGESKSTTSPSTTPQKSDAKAMDKQLELSIAAWDIQTSFDKPNAKNDAIYNDIAKKFNITIKPVQVTWNDWTEKVKVWAASNQLPDMFANPIATDNTALYTTWAKQGVIKALPDDLSAYPNLKKLMSTPAVQPLKVDGKFYMIPRNSGDDTPITFTRPIRYRKDWAEQAGFTSAPKSFEDFAAMTKAVMKQHPGIAGLSVNNKDYLLTQFLGSFPEFEVPNSWVKEDGKWIPAFTSPKTYTGIGQLRSLYADSILDKDFAIQKDGDGVNKFLSGQSFALYGLENVTDANVDQFKKANPGVEPSKAVSYLDMWPAADGKHYYFNLTPYWSETFFPGSLSDEKFDRALRLMDYLVSEKFQILRDNGIENIDYKVDNGQFVSLLKEGENLGDKYPATWGIGWVGAWGNSFYRGQTVLSNKPDVAALQKVQIDTNKNRAKEYTPVPVNFDIFLMSTPAKNKLGGLNSNIMDDVVKVILSKDDPVAQWKEIVKGYDAKGVQEAIKEVNDEAAKRNIK